MYNANGVFVTCSHLEAGRGVPDVFCVYYDLREVVCTVCGVYFCVNVW